MEKFECLGFVHTRNMVRNVHPRSKELAGQHSIALRIVVLSIS